MTERPERFDPRTYEAAWRERWAADDIYRADDDDPRGVGNPGANEAVGAQLQLSDRWKRCRNARSPVGEKATTREFLARRAQPSS